MNIRKELNFEIYKKYTRLIFGNVDLQMTHSFKEYRFKNPNSLIVLNAEIYDGNKLVWYGDLDLSKCVSKLYKLVEKLNTEICIYNSGEFKEGVEPLLRVKKNKKQSLRKEESKFYDFNETLDSYVRKAEQLLPDTLNGIYEKNNYIHSVKIPSFDKFDYKNNKISPFDFFYKEVLNSLDVEIDKVILDSSKMIISKNDLDILLDYFEKWLLLSKTIEERNYELKERIDFARKNISPLVFEGSLNGPEWARKGFVYVKESFYEEK